MCEKDLVDISLLTDITYDSIEAKEKRRKSVERCLAILLTATKGPNELFMNALNSYIDGELTLAELQERVDRLEYI